MQNHPFVDGNKRTGTAAALIFLDLNGIAGDIPDDKLVDLVLSVAQGRAAKRDHRFSKTTCDGSVIASCRRLGLAHSVSSASAVRFSLPEALEITPDLLATWGSRQS